MSNRKHSRLAAFRAALRFARRDAWASKGRSALIMSLVAIPVAGLSGVALVGLSMVPTAEETATVELGEAEARITVVGPPDETLVQNPVEPGWWQTQRDTGSSNPALDPDDEVVDPATLLPRNAKLVAIRPTATTVSASGVDVGMVAIEGEAWDASFAGKFDLELGRAPSRTSEVMVTPSGLERLGVALGDTVTVLETGRELTIVGLLDAAAEPDATPMIFGALGTFTGDRQAIPGDELYLFDVALDWERVQEFNRSGSLVLSRAVLLDPPPPGSYQLTDSGQLQGAAATVVQLTAVGVAFAVIEVALLAGAAFTVGARRQQRSLATIASVGGHRRTLFQTVSAGGLVLGLASSLVGIGIGIAAGSLFMVLTHDGSATQYWGFHLSVPAFVGIALFSVFVGWIAALLPARIASRMDVLAALRGARRPAAARRGRPWIGGGIVIVGTAVSLTGVIVGANSIDETGYITNLTSYQLAVPAVVSGPLIAQVGLLILAPALLRLIGGAIARFGTAPRVAGRDAARTPSRTVPALAAVMSAVFLATFLLAFLGSAEESGRQQYSRFTAEGQLMVWLPDARATGSEPDPEIGERIAGLVSTQLDTEQARVLSGVAGFGDYQPTDSAPVVSVGLRPDAECESAILSGPNPFADCDAPDHVLYTLSGSRIWTGTVDDLALIVDDEVSAEAKRTLSAGGAVALYEEYVSDDGTMRLDWSPASAYFDNNGSTPTPERSITIDAVVQQPEHPIQFDVFILESTAEQLELPTLDRYVLASFTTLPDETALDALRASLRTLTGNDQSVGARLERGPASTIGTVGWALVGIGALIALAASAVALGLARADGRRDDATLSSLGAGGVLRRSVAFWQATIIAGTGAVLGGATGVMAPALMGAVGLMPFAPPWDQLAVLVVGLPLVIAVGSWLLTRGARFDERLQRTLG